MRNPREKRLHKNHQPLFLLKLIKSAVDRTIEISYMVNPKTKFNKSNNFSYAIVVVVEHP
ncbi:hypothetical protein HanPI659440_Chr13g0510791 [Helianthus annuus]|nr:hypothetical protein HanPI659440_Chr13g0510791 [Helianthus annuus]